MKRRTIAILLIIFGLLVVVAIVAIVIVGAGTGDTMENLTGCWSTWSTWTDCQQICGSESGNGLKSRHRTLDDLLAKDCNGDTSENIPCDGAQNVCEDSCWTPWTQWSSCKADCKAEKGVSTQSRSPKVSFESGCSEGEAEITRDCPFETNNCVVSCWELWEPWSMCNGTCSSTTGFIVQNHQIVPIVTECSGNVTESLPCEISPDDCNECNSNEPISTYLGVTGSPKSNGPENAVDNIFETAYSNNPTIDYPWIELILPCIAQIVGINVTIKHKLHEFSRDFHNVEVRVGEKLFDQAFDLNGQINRPVNVNHLCHYMEGLTLIPTIHQIFQCNTTLTGNHVTIQILDINSTLFIREVIIIQETAAKGQCLNSDYPLEYSVSSSYPYNNELEKENHVLIDNENTFQSSRSKYSWLQIELECRASITGITLRTKPNFVLNNLEIRAGDLPVPFQANELASGRIILNSFCAFIAESLSNIETLHCPEPIPASYISIQLLETKQYLLIQYLELHTAA